MHARGALAQLVGVHCTIWDTLWLDSTARKQFRPHDGATITNSGSSQGAHHVECHRDYEDSPEAGLH